MWRPFHASQNAPDTLSRGAGQGRGGRGYLLLHREGMQMTRNPEKDPEVRARNTEAARRYRERHPERVIESRKRDRDTHPSAAAIRTRRYRERHPGIARSEHLKRRYGFTHKQYIAMLAAQGGGCALCGNPPGPRNLCVDHCHATGRVRGLLCSPCNRAIGLLHEDPVMLRKSAEYLEKGGD